MKNFRQPVGWRDEAINAVIRAYSTTEGTGTDLVHVFIRQHLPDSVTYSRDMDRLKLIQFLRAETAEMQSLISGSANTFGYYDDGVSHALYAWYSVAWRGQRIEIVMPPDHGSDGDAIFIGSDDTLLSEFVEMATAH